MSLDPLIPHAATYQRGGDVVICHNKVVLCLSEFLKVTIKKSHNFDFKKSQSCDKSHLVNL